MPLACTLKNSNIALTTLPTWEYTRCREILSVNIFHGGVFIVITLTWLCNLIFRASPRDGSTHMWMLKMVVLWFFCLFCYFIGKLYKALLYTVNSKVLYAADKKLLSAADGKTMFPLMRKQFAIYWR